jgi:hypothetical protein
VNYKPGRVLLTGNWACGQNVLYCAARRTLEGGRNLENEYWASRFEKKESMYCICDHIFANVCQKKLEYFIEKILSCYGRYGFNFMNL